MARSILHWGPVVALTIIATLASATVYILAIGSRELSTTMRVNAIVWVLVVAVLLYNFFMAVYIGAGAVPLNWVKEEQE